MSKFGIPLAGLLLFLSVSALVAENYYIDADGGSDSNPGTSPAEAWATLGKANTWAFQPGDQILLQKGDIFPGKLYFNGASGSAEAPITVATYGDGTRPVINASGYLAGVHIRNSQHIEVRDLEITGDGGAMVDGSPEGKRYGVYMDRSGSGSINFITVDNIHIHDIYPNVGTESEGALPTTHMGTGVAMSGGDLSVSTNIVVRNCIIERMGFKAVEMKQVSFVEILDNNMKDIGGPAIQPSRVNDLVVRGNVVDGSGAFIDPRMHGRGSGIWPWGSQRVLIEKNTFMGARGRADSCGIHIDFNCRDVVVQYNLSIDNSGGFVEILGNNYNCTYRYNISINDGSRVKGEPSNGPGTLANNQDGHIIWTSGYVGSGNPNSGPFNSYIYNNTIYVKIDIRSTFSILDSSDGLLIANNIFYVEGPSIDVTGDNADDYTQAMADRVIWQNNLYQRTGILPVFNLDLFTDTAPVIGDPQFTNAGGLAPADYIPASTAFVEDQGILIENIPGDEIGLKVGLPVGEDFFGNPIVGLPDMGAIEMGGTVFPIPPGAFLSPPAFRESNSAEMSSVEGPFNTEYYFAEVSGNFGGDDSGWQIDSHYIDEGLLPNTTYRYTVTLRDALDQPGSSSPQVPVTTPTTNPYESLLILSEDFSSQPDPANETPPYPIAEWFVGFPQEDQSSSVRTVGTDDALRTGFGYDEVIVFWISDQSISLGKGYRFTGEWGIDTVLDTPLGITAAIAEFDSLTGELVQSVKEVSVGELLAPFAGQSGTFQVNLTPSELAAAGVSSLNKVGVYFYHGGAYSPGRNDVYVVDNLELSSIGSGTDSDMDGIPDSVEPGLGLNPANGSDGAEDWDQDGQSNFAEFLTGTNLNDSSDFFAGLISINSGVPEVRLDHRNILPGRLYIFEHSQDFSAANSWSALDALYGSLAEPGIEKVFRYPFPVDTEFFRIRVEWE